MTAPSLKLEDCLRTPEGDTRRDIATLLKFRDGVESYNPMYLFWDLYRPQTDIGVDLAPTPVSLHGGRVTLHASEVFVGESPAPPLSESYEGLVLDLLERLYRQNRVRYEPDGDSLDFKEFRKELDLYDDSGVLAFPGIFKQLIVYLHVAAARAFRVKQRDGYTEECLDCLREVERTRTQLDCAKGLYWSIDDGSYIETFLSAQHSAVATAAIAFVELARVSRREGRYDEALHYFVGALRDYSDAIFLCGQEGCDDAWPAMNPGERRREQTVQCPSGRRAGPHIRGDRRYISTTQRERGTGELVAGCH